MIVVTTNDVVGREIVSYLGVVRGIVVRSPSLGKSIVGGLRSLVGGNISQFEQVCDRARQDAFDRMIGNALGLGADAIVGMRFDATEFLSGVTEVLAYGTAVRLA